MYQFATVANMELYIALIVLLKYGTKQKKSKSKAIDLMSLRITFSNGSIFGSKFVVVNNVMKYGSYMWVVMRYFLYCGEY